MHPAIIEAISTHEGQDGVIPTRPRNLVEEQREAMRNLVDPDKVPVFPILFPAPEQERK